MLGSNHDVSGLTVRYGIEIKGAICAPDAPVPNMSLMTEH
jgi:hypothetical protein